MYLNYQKGLFLLSYMLLFVMTAAAADYKPMIRYDRVWECVCTDGVTYTVKYMKFDGSESFNGNTYHRIVTFNKINYKGELPDDEILESFYDISENEGYMREEEGRIFTLVKEKNLGDYYLRSIYMSEPLLDDESVTEEILYDFSCPEGESYRCFSTCSGSGEIVDFAVVAKETVDIDNEDYTVLYACLKEFAGSQGKESAFKIIEGIGPTEYGCLNFNTFLGIPTKIWLHNEFNRLFDNRGMVLYRSKCCIEYKTPDNIFTSVDSIKNQETISIHDNTLTFTAENTFNTIVVYDMNGRSVKKKTGNGRISVRTDELVPGIYAVVALSNGKTAVRRKFTVK